ncbi:hypothetical protein EBU99_00020 [bacterium]|nr:hypothetical protein [bacterium]
MSAFDYKLFIISQALSELGDNLWGLGLRNYLFENSPWTPALGLAAVFLLQAIPVFFLGPWLSRSIGQRWRTMALAADILRLLVTIAFSIGLTFLAPRTGPTGIVYLLLACQLLLEIGTLIFQNCKNCLIPVLYPNPADIPKAHLWANVASLSAAGVVPLVFLIAMPSQGQIRIEWLFWAAWIDAASFAISGLALLFLRNSQRLQQIKISPEEKPSTNPIRQFKEGLQVVRKYPSIARLLVFSFIYNFCLMGPFEIGHVTFLRKDLSLPPEALAINLLLFLAGVFSGTFLAQSLWGKSKSASHLRRFSHSIVWDGLTFFPICLFTFAKNKLSGETFLAGLSVLFFFHYMLVPFVKVSRMASIQTLSEQKDWSTLLGFHAVAVEGAAALSVILVALLLPNASGTVLLALGGTGASLCGGFGLLSLSKGYKDPVKCNNALNSIHVSD